MSNQKDLKQLLAEIAAVEADAAIDLATVPFRTRPGMTARREAARAVLEPARAAYLEDARRRMVGVVARGARAAEFAKVVEETGDGVAVSASELWGRLADSFYGSVGPSLQFGATQQALFNEALREALRDLEVDPYTAAPPDYRPRRVENRDAAVALARELATLSAPAIGSLYVALRAGERALAARYKESTLPVVILDAAAEEEFPSLGRGWGEVAVSEEEPVDKAAVTKAFQEVARQLKRKRTTK